MEIRIELLKQNDYQGAVDCILNNFLMREPMVNALEVNYDEFKYFVEIYVKKAVVDELSAVAKIDDKVVGALINEDLLTSPPIGVEKCTPKLAPVFDIIEKLDSIYIKESKPKLNEILHCFMGAVYKEYANHSILNKMLNFSFKNAKSIGYKGTALETTGNGSYKVLNKRPELQITAAIDYKTYEFNSKKVFEHAKGGTQCVLFTGKIE